MDMFQVYFNTVAHPSYIYINPQIVTGSREWVWERPLDRGKLGTGHYVIMLSCSSFMPCYCAMSDDIYLCSLMRSFVLVVNFDCAYVTVACI